MRVGDMALDAGHRDPDIDRTPAPDLHHIAQPMFRRRLADQTEVRYMAVRFHPFQKLHRAERSEEHTSELQSLMRISYAVFCLKKQINTTDNPTLLTPSTQKTIIYISNIKQ